jgi:hypothetical protein
MQNRPFDELAHVLQYSFDSADHIVPVSQVTSAVAAEFGDSSGAYVTRGSLLAGGAAAAGGLGFPVVARASAAMRPDIAPLAPGGRGAGVLALGTMEGVEEVAGTDDEGCPGSGVSGAGGRGVVL